MSDETDVPDGPELPEPRWWPEPITAEQYNCGLEAAVSLASKDDWREAIDHNFNDF